MSVLPCCYAHLRIKSGGTPYKAVKKIKLSGNGKMDRGPIFSKRRKVN